MLIEYSANNSGGSWWLSDEDWQALEDAGWTVHWYSKMDPKEKKEYLFMDENANTFLGASATKAEKQFETPADAIREFESVTGKCASEEGCNCCGPPHSFSWDPPDGSWGYASGEEVLRVFYGKDQPSSLREAIELLNRKE